MKTFRMNSLMAGILYLMGTVFGIASAVLGGEVLASSVSNKALSADLLKLVANNSPQITAAAFLILMMGISLVAMTVFLYPIFAKDSKELATGMLLFRGALEGSYYLISTMGFLIIVLLSNEYVSAGYSAPVLESLANAFYHLQSFLGSVGSIVFLIGATCIYISFYRTRLIPRWLTIWGLVGVLPYLAYAVLNFFNMDNGIGFYLQMPLAVQELVMAVWLIIKGFDPPAIDKLMSKSHTAIGYN